MEKAADKVSLYNTRGGWVSRDMLASITDRRRYTWIVSVLALIGVWQAAAMLYGNTFIMPTPWMAISAFGKDAIDPWIHENLLLTIRRVMTGFGYALVIGVPIGYLMGYSMTARRYIDPLIDSLRQIPMMAWVPLTIVWFGLGDGPTVFLIAFVGVFAVILNTTAGVEGISKDYYNAARSLGAKPWSIFAHVIVPGSFPGILTGMRVALGAGWMSVICAEFVATSAGFGFLMVDAQTRMETDRLMGLMIMGALVGFTIDRMLLLTSRVLARWKVA